MLVLMGLYSVQNSGTDKLHWMPFVQHTCAAAFAIGLGSAVFVAGVVSMAAEGRAGIVCDLVFGRSDNSRKR